MSDRTERRLSAIVSADVVGYSRLMGVDEAGTLEALANHRADLIDPLIARHGGRIVKSMGDGLLLEFPSVVDATQCAIDIQDGMAARNEGVDDAARIIFRIGINLGDVVVRNGDIFGNGVNVAARLEALAEPGGICLSGTVHREVKNKLHVDFEYLGEQLVHNIAEPIRAFRIGGSGKGEGEKIVAPAEAEASRVSSSSRQEKPSIAVLPLTNMTGDPDQDYFSDGITEDIITELSRFRILHVVARHSSFAFKGEKVDIREVGRKLGADYVLEGSVRRAANRVRITAQLIEAETGNHVWAERYDRELEDIFAVQDEVTRSIVAVLPGRVQGAVADRASRKPTDNMRAYEFLLQGKAVRDGFSAEATAQARELFKKAIALDPRYAKAHALLADTYFVDFMLGLGSEEVSKVVLDLSRKAATLDSTDVSIQEELGFAYVSVGMWEDAESQFDRALSQIVNEAEQMLWCGYGLMMVGRHDEARDVTLKAMRLDPLHPASFEWVLGQACFFAKRYEEAIRALKGEAMLNSLAYCCLAGAYAYLGRTEEAHRALEAFRRERRAEFASRNISVEGDTISTLARGFRKMLRREVDWDHLVDGLRRARLPGKF